MDQLIMQAINDNYKQTKKEKQLKKELEKAQRINSFLEVIAGIFVFTLIFLVMQALFL